MRTGARVAGLLLAFVATLANAAEPTLEVTGADGAPVQLALRDGETALILHFWASWCPECVRELPALARVAARCAGVVQVAAVNVAESLAVAQEFRARHSPSLPLLRDPEGKLWRRFARGLPANLIQTRQSQSVVAGPYAEAEWEERLRALGCSMKTP